MVQLVFAAVLALTVDASATIQGVVRAERTLEPIPFATVNIRDLNRRAQTDAHGFFVLSGIPAGRWRVESNALGYDANAVTVATTDDGTVRLDFELRLRPVALPGVRVPTGEPPVAFSSPPDPGPAVVRMSASSLKTIPGLAEPDLLRALQQLPSVAAISDYSTALYVRGGAADQNLLQLDGMPLFNPYHLGGLFSAAPADAVSTVDVWAGALPASAGDRLSSAVVINTREGGKDRLRTSGGIGLISANATVDGPLRGGRGSFLLSGRRTYLNAITDVGYRLGLIDFTVPYGFTDVYGKFSHRIGALGSVAVSGYWDGERIHMPERMRDNLDDYVDFRWGSRLMSLSYRQPIGGSLLLEARAGYSDFKADFDGWSIERQGRATCGGNIRDTSQLDGDTVHCSLTLTRTRDVAAGADLTWFRDRHTVRGGVRFDAYLFDHDLSAMPDTNEYLAPFAQRSSLRNIAVYLEDEWQPSERFGIRGGLRLLDAGRLGTAWLPRLGARLRLSPSLAITAGGGLYAQTLRSMKDDESVAASLIAYELLTSQPADAGLARGTDCGSGRRIHGSPHTH